MGSRKRPMHELYAQDRAEGMTYREIAGKYGVSYQAVAQSLSHHAPSQFRPFDAEACVYPVLRKWLNENKVSKTELLRRMGRVPCGRASTTLRSYLRGACYPPKGYIDDLLRATGLTYEELFWKETAAMPIPVETGMANGVIKVETNFYDKEEIFPDCTVQVLTNTATGDVSVGWWKNGE